MVTGATGKVGSEVVMLLARDGATAIAVTRSPADAALPAGARILGADPSDPQTLVGALGEVGAILLVPRALGAAGAELVSLAADRGVERVVVVSATTVERRVGEERFWTAFRAVEDAARASGMEWTILRCADFAANALVWVPQIRSGDVVRGAHGDAVTSPIHERDVAEVAARTLVDASHAGRTYVLTGSHGLSQQDRVRLIGAAVGRHLVWEETHPAEVRRAMIASGLPDEAPDRLLGYFADHVRRPGTTSTDVGTVLGRPPLSFARWAAEHAPAFQG
jgi:uncharacterized protein YbjT (DUF2867 family)